jgi:hypothetical protein
MLIELANKTIIAFSLATSELFYDKCVERVFQGEKDLLTSFFRPIGLWNLQDMQHRRDETNETSHILPFFNLDYLRRWR